MVDMGGMPDAVVADLMKALGQDVLQIASDELMAFDSSGLPAAAFAVLVAEGDMGLVQVEEAMIRDGNTKHIARQVVQYDRFLPGRNADCARPSPGTRSSDLPAEPLRIASSQPGRELAPNQPGQGFDGNQILLLAGDPTGSSH